MYCVCKRGVGGGEREVSAQVWLLKVTKRPPPKLPTLVLEMEPGGHQLVRLLTNESLNPLALAYQCLNYRHVLSCPAFCVGAGES